jgi:amidase
MAVTKTFDSVGGMAKSATDLAILTGFLQDKDLTDDDLKPSSNTGPGSEWEGIRIGFLDPRIWKLPAWLVAPNSDATVQIVSSSDVPGFVH